MAETLYPLIVKTLAPVMTLLEQHSIECHTQCENGSADYLSLFAFLEGHNREKEHTKDLALEEFEKKYYGIEVEICAVILISFCLMSWIIPSLLLITVAADYGGRMHTGRGFPLLSGLK